MHVRTGPPTTYEGPPGPGNKTLLVMSPVPTFTLVGKHPSSPSQHGSTPPTRDSSSGPQPEDTGTLSPLRVDRGGVSTNQSPPPCCPSTTAQESVPSLPLAQLDPPCRPRLANSPPAPSTSNLQAFSRPASTHPEGRLPPQVRGTSVPLESTRVLPAMQRTIPPRVSRSSSDSWTLGQRRGHLDHALLSFVPRSDTLGQL
jgi:hypothetical protein